ncbi:putative RNA-directed DNA polymerase from transposon BS [Merluccius polli]|uniref:RNA-directed DNA polymerase from transposon BS n=1 Tax=Merluccius polli TaxID=89951 RepID=A0AA47PD58_MERPO|nr:putative RNA-directed DNA polymerase from transposon BS [Merluccius polli]
MESGWTRPHQPVGAKGMFQPALWSFPAPLQPEPTTSASTSALENILPGPSAPKIHPVTLEDYRPVALTSHIMKVMERLVLAHLRPLVCSSQDPLQFAYQLHVGVDDAIIYLLQKAYSSLDCPNTSVRVMFFNFSSAFNTIQPRLLKAKLENMQGTVLSPFLFTTYTADFQYCMESCHLQKFSDDTAIVGCVEGGREAEYRDLVDRFMKWCGENHLQLNVAKTREMVVDFRRNKTLPSPVSIGGTDVDMVDKYKYLGVTLDN